MKAGSWTIALFLLWLALWLPGACTDRGVVGGECARGLVACDGVCVNIGSSVDNCGSCGNQCERGEECQVGNCRQCRSGEELCDGRCVDLASSADHCGRCGSPCDKGEVCSEGSCRADLGDGGPGSGGASSLPDGSIFLPDGAVLLPDGAVVAGGSGGTGGSSGTGGSGNAGDAGPCAPPYDSVEHCGDCQTSCANSEPYCVPTGGTFRCANSCEDPLVLCGGQCVDTTSDPKNCGACGRVCPTAICVDSQCVGQFPGHVVLTCISYEVSGAPLANAPQTIILGNAVTITKRSNIRILAWDQYATNAAKMGVVSALDQAVGNGNYTLTTVTRSEVASSLSVQDYDVLLVYDQARAPAGQLSAWGRDLADVMDDFALAGGTVLVLASASGTEEMNEFIESAGLLGNASGVTDATSEQLYTRAPADAVGVGVLSPFIGLHRTCTFDTSDMSDATSVFVVTDESPTSGMQGNPVVVHRVRTP